MVPLPSSATSMALVGDVHVSKPNRFFGSDTHLDDEPDKEPVQDATTIKERTRRRKFKLLL
jgi:hypothetical protein